MLKTSDDSADFELLSKANHKRKFAVSIGLVPAHIQLALERAFDNDWIVLIDVSYIAADFPDRLFRIFRLTDVGMVRLAALSPSKN